MFPPGSPTEDDQDGPVWLSDGFAESIDLSPIPAGRAMRGQVYLTATADDPSTIRSIEASPADPRDAAAIGADEDPAADRARCLVSTATLADGPHRVALAATDGRGNRSEMPVDFVVDNTAPTLAVAPIAPSNTGVLTVTGTIADGERPGPAPLTLLFTIGTADIGQVNAPIGPFTAHVMVPCDGSVVIQVVAVDGAGNRRQAITRDALCDTQAPTLGLESSIFVQESSLNLVPNAVGGFDYATPAGATQVLITDQIQALHFEKYFNRLDAGNANLPTFRLRTMDGEGDVPRLAYEDEGDAR